MAANQAMLNGLKTECDSLEKKLKMTKGELASYKHDLKEEQKDNAKLQKKVAALEEQVRASGSPLKTPQKGGKPARKTNGYQLYAKHVRAEVRSQLLLSGRKTLEPYEVPRRIAQLWKEADQEYREEWLASAKAAVSQEEQDFLAMVACLEKCSLITDKAMVKPLAVHILSHTNPERESSYMLLCDPYKEIKPLIDLDKHRPSPRGR